ncbi:DNA mismatch repair protein MutS, partial [Candidatus Peregrinibacteria bacterium]|nr:DNA mismatch repair protein MutS [Candidatus Peregrinibacteria bacterium]
EDDKGVVFLHKIQPGGTARSYGIEVAKLAGLPPEVIKKSEHILQNLEEGVVEKGIREQMKGAYDSSQIGLFDPSQEAPQMLEREHGKLTHPALERLKEIDVNRMTPLEALQALEELKKEG